LTHIHLLMHPADIDATNNNPSCEHIYAEQGQQ
jgi:hypothetical protein